MLLINELPIIESPPRPPLSLKATSLRPLWSIWITGNRLRGKGVYLLLIGGISGESRLSSVANLSAVCVFDAMETDTPPHQRASLGGTNDLTAGDRDSSILPKSCHPQGRG